MPREPNKAEDEGEGLAGPTDGLVHRPLLIQEARIIAPHARDDIVIRLLTGNLSLCEPVLFKEVEVVALVLMCLPERRHWRCW